MHIPSTLRSNHSSKSTRHSLNITVRTLTNNFPLLKLKLYYHKRLTDYHGLQIKSTSSSTPLYTAELQSYSQDGTDVTVRMDRSNMLVGKIPSTPCMKVTPCIFQTTRTRARERKHKYTQTN